MDEYDFSTGREDLIKALRDAQMDPSGSMIPPNPNAGILANAMQGGQGPQDPSGLADSILSRIQIAGGFSSGKENGVEASGYGGRVGMNFPQQNGDNLNVGVSGQGYHAKGPGFNVRSNDVTGGDITYSRGNDSLSLRYAKDAVLEPSRVQTPTMEAEARDGVLPIQKNLLQLLYRKSF